MMGDTKHTFRWFTITQYRQEEEYLSDMHRKGWKFKRIPFLGIYEFEKCEPENVSYRLDYNQEGTANKAEYVQMFADCGWEYLQDFTGYSYFRKPAEAEGENEEIFCDEESKLDMMRRVYRGRIIPLLILYLGVIIPQFAMKSFGYADGDSGDRSMVICFLIMGIVYLIEFGRFSVMFYRYEKNVLGEDRNMKMKYVAIFAGIILSVLFFAGIGLYPILF